MDADEDSEIAAAQASKRNQEERIRLREEFVQLMQQRFLAVRTRISAQ